MSKSETNEIIKSELRNWNFAGIDHLDLFRFSNFEFRAFHYWKFPRVALSAQETSTDPRRFVRPRLPVLRPVARRSCRGVHRSIPAIRGISCRAGFERRRFLVRLPRNAGIQRSG